MRAAWWWIDRWRKSTAYTDMTAEEQGVYRNLLDELWIRDGSIPKDERILRKIGGDYDAWPRVRDNVLARFYLSDQGWRNETHDEVMKRSQYQAEKQRRYRERKKNVTDNVTGDDDGNVPVSPSPSPSKDKDPAPNDNDPVRSKRTRKTYTPEFETFWKAYSARRRVGKGAAFKAWNEGKNGLSPPKEMPEMVTEAAQRHAEHFDRIGTETPKIPHPSTWLNARRWEDELTEHDGPVTRQDRALFNIQKAREADESQHIRQGDGSARGDVFD